MEGENIMRMARIELDEPPAMAPCINIACPIGPDSPLWGKTHADLENEGAAIYVALAATDNQHFQEVYARRFYLVQVPPSSPRSSMSCTCVFCCVFSTCVFSPRPRASSPFKYVQAHPRRLAPHDAICRVRGCPRGVGRVALSLQVPGYCSQNVLGSVAFYQSPYGIPSPHICCSTRPVHCEVGGVCACGADMRRPTVWIVTTSVGIAVAM